MLRTLALLALLGLAAASCPNDCSGNGYCNQYSACNCYRNWMGADCSQRSCAWAHSFVDIPQGDLNADGRLDVPNIYKISLCSATSFWADNGANDHMTSYNGDQHTAAGSGGSEASKLSVEDADSSDWNTGIEILENVYPEDEYTLANDPYGVVALCNERDETLDYAIVVHVSAASDPGMICNPNGWQRDDAGMTSYAAGVNRFARCDDILTAQARNVPDLKRGFTLTPTGGTWTSNPTGFIGSWSDMTYSTQMTNDALWERYPDDHFHAGAPAGINYGTLDEPKTDDIANGAADFVKSDWDEAHFYAECSAKGLCDRSTGLCQCFPGFTGDGCMRTACPNDCSGHGVCERLVDQSDLYLSWDAYKTQVCVCDAGYSGPHCGLRECPKGDDPVTRLHDGASLQAYTADGRMHTGHRTQTAEIQVIGVTDYSKLITGRGNAGTNANAKSTQSAPFALEFEDEMGDKWTTRTIDFRGGAYTDCTASYLSEACSNCASTTNDCQTEDGFGVCDGNGKCVAGSATGDFADWAGGSEAGAGRPAANRNQHHVAADIESALEALPNQVIPNVEVNPQKIALPVGCTCTTVSDWSCTSYGAAIPNAVWLDDAGTNGPIVQNGRVTGITACAASPTVFDAPAAPAVTNGLGGESLYAITFVENAGDIPMLGARYQWEFELSNPGAEKDCLHNIDTSTGGDGTTTTDNTAAVTDCIYSMNKADGSFDDVLVQGSFYVDELFKGDKEEATCSNRGICDYSTGLCKCFAGFTSHDCSVQNALSSA